MFAYRPPKEILRVRRAWVITASVCLLSTAANEHSLRSVSGHVASWLIVFLIGQIAFNLGVEYGEGLPHLSERCLWCEARVNDGGPKIGRPTCRDCMKKHGA